MAGTLPALDSGAPPQPHDDGAFAEPPHPQAVGAAAHPHDVDPALAAPPDTAPAAGVASRHAARLQSTGPMLPILHAERADGRDRPNRRALSGIEAGHAVELELEP